MSGARLAVLRPAYASRHTTLEAPAAVTGLDGRTRPAARPAPEQLSQAGQLAPVEPVDDDLSSAVAADSARLAPARFKRRAVSARATTRTCSRRSAGSSPPRSRVRRTTGRPDPTRAVAGSPRRRQRQGEALPGSRGTSRFECSTRGEGVDLEHRIVTGGVRAGLGVLGQHLSQEPHRRDRSVPCGSRHEPNQLLGGHRLEVLLRLRGSTSIDGLGEEPVRPARVIAAPAQPALNCPAGDLVLACGIGDRRTSDQARQHPAAMLAESAHVPKGRRLSCRSASTGAPGRRLRGQIRVLVGPPPPPGGVRPPSLALRLAGAAVLCSRVCARPLADGGKPCNPARFVPRSGSCVTPKPPSSRV